MTNLTDKWKKGELPEGYYYVKDGENMIVDEVLAPVPSYEEYLEMEGHCGAYSDINQQQKEEISAYERLVAELKQENTKLKELLKRVVNVTDFYYEIKAASVVDYGLWYNIANEIKQVLGEE